MQEMMISPDEHISDYYGEERRIDVLVFGIHFHPITTIDEKTLRHDIEQGFEFILRGFGFRIISDTFEFEPRTMVNGREISRAKLQAGFFGKTSTAKQPKYNAYGHYSQIRMLCDKKTRDEIDAGYDKVKLEEAFKQRFRYLRDL